MVPGKYLVEAHNKSTRVLIQGLFELGLITDTVREWQRKFYILHPVSHYLGMDVHDAGEYGISDLRVRESMARDTVYGRILEQGMVLTVEPGLYFRSNGLTQLSALFGKEASLEEIQDFIDRVSHPEAVPTASQKDLICNWSKSLNQKK